MAQTTEKQAAEVVNQDFDFSPKMDEGEAIDGITSVTVTNMGLVDGSSNITCGSNSYSGQTGRTSVSGGTAGEKYKITMVVTTDADQTLELDGFMVIRNE